MNNETGIFQAVRGGNAGNPRWSDDQRFDIEQLDFARFALSDRNAKAVSYHGSLRDTINSAERERLRS